MKNWLPVLLTLTNISSTVIFWGLFESLINSRSIAQTSEDTNSSLSNEPQIENQDALLQVDGELTSDDQTLDNNSRYDIHTFRGRTGQMIKINLQSDEFDTYLLLEDPSGERIAQNDDSNGTNSEIIVQLPGDGIYRIISNAYDLTGRGTYRLTVISATVDEIQVAQTRLKAEQLEQQGSEQYQIGQFRDALQSWEAALELYREAGDRSGEATILGYLGIAYSRLGQYQQAIDLYEQTLTVAREIGDLSREGIALGNLGNFYSSLGQYAQAIDLYEQSLAIARATGNRGGESRAMGNLGIIYRMLGQYEQAIDYYELSLAIAREIGDLAGEANALNNIGIAYYSLELYNEAIEYQQQALAISREIGDRRGEAGILNNLGLLSDSLGNYAEAIAYQQQELCLFVVYE